MSKKSFYILIIIIAVLTIVIIIIKKYTCEPNSADLECHARSNKEKPNCIRHYFNDDEKIRWKLQPEMSDILCYYTPTDATNLTFTYQFDTIKNKCFKIWSDGDWDHAAISDCYGQV